jgi:hypothetical protein
MRFGSNPPRFSLLWTGEAFLSVLLTNAGYAFHAEANAKAKAGRYTTVDEGVDANAIKKMLRIYMKRRFKPRLDRISEAANSAVER